ncbi:MAG TPA: flagellar hook-length control protein FliK [Desulfobacterales bacterium]
MNLGALFSSLFQIEGAGESVVCHYGTGQGGREDSGFLKFLQAASSQVGQDASTGVSISGDRAAAETLPAEESPDESQGETKALAALLAVVADMRSDSFTTRASVVDAASPMPARVAAEPTSGAHAFTEALSAEGDRPMISTGGIGAAGAHGKLDAPLPAPETVPVSTDASRLSATVTDGFAGAPRNELASSASAGGTAEAPSTGTSPNGIIAGRVASEAAGVAETYRSDADSHATGSRQTGSNALEPVRSSMGQQRLEGGERSMPLRPSGFPTVETLAIAGQDIGRDSKAADLTADTGDPGKYGRSNSGQENQRTAAPEALRSSAPGPGEPAMADMSRLFQVEEGSETDVDGECKVGEASNASDRSPGRVESSSATTDGASRSGRSFLNDSLTQLVDKAVFRLKNGQSEARIHLKPETLGHVRMQISTENHQITLKILTEFPVVKEMIENNIGQLRSDLQAHGLEIGRLEISVAGDGCNSGRNCREGQRRDGHKHRVDSAESDAGESAMPNALLHRPSGTSTVIDYFV